MHLISIDFFANSSELDTVNYIKMDIEGSEMRALRGARTYHSTLPPKACHMCIPSVRRIFGRLPTILLSGIRFIAYFWGTTRYMKRKQFYTPR